VRPGCPGVGLLLLSQCVEAGYALRLSELIGALERVADGETVADPAP
jgi:hypothetical protein